MEPQPLKIIQISDIHLFSDSNKKLLSVNTEESFKAVVDLVHKESDKFDFVLLTGDLSQDGSDSSYRRLATFLESFAVPIYCIPGNHDNNKVMAEVYSQGKISNDRQIIVRNWQLILLDSQKPKAVEGYLDQKQLDYLRQCLEAYPNHKAIVVFHHQPIPVGCKWLDRLGVTNADEFWQVISQYRNVHSVLFGHVHQEFEGNKNGIKCYAAPSTCIQFKRKQSHFGLENIPPGYRWVNLYDDGRIDTGVKRLDKYIGVFDKDATGY